MFARNATCLLNRKQVFITQIHLFLSRFINIIAKGVQKLYCINNECSLLEYDYVHE